MPNLQVSVSCEKPVKAKQVNADKSNFFMLLISNKVIIFKIQIKIFAAF
jgi:hypothetical protein